MEQKKFDPNSIIALLIFGILLWMYQNQPDPAVIAAEKAKEMVQEAKAKELNDKVVTRSCCRYHWRCCAISTIRKKLGSFAYSATLPSAQNSSTTIENKLVANNS
jgi:YidC/Oxa1 family membrane protein insertase